MENQLERTIKVLRTYADANIYLINLKCFVIKKGIDHQFTIPRTLQQNCVAERKNKPLLDMVRSMIAQANVSISY